MDAAAAAKRALSLLEEADGLRAVARALLDPLYRARGWRGSSDALTSICSGDSIVPKEELPVVQVRRRAGLERIAREVDATAKGTAGPESRGDG